MKRRRMQLVDQHSSEEAEPVLSMINVVFLMLIFFMIGGVIARPDLFAIDLPKSKIEQVTSREVFDLYIDRNGKMGMNSEVITLDLLSSKLQALDVDRDSFQFQIRADRNTPSGLVINVMELLRESGFSETRLITTRNG